MIYPILKTNSFHQAIALSLSLLSLSLSLSLSHIYMLLLYHLFCYYLFRCRTPVRILFSCALDSITVPKQEGASQIVVKKKRRSIVGEQILPLCKIVFSHLVEVEGACFPISLLVSLTTDTQDLVHPLASDVKLLEEIVGKLPKVAQYVGEEACVHFRHILLCLNTQEWEVCISIRVMAHNAL